MVSAPRPLIARLRRRLVTTVWLLAFVVLAKGLMVSLCMTDGLGGPDPATATLVATSSDVAAHTDENAASCWHAGSGGCHCTCLHASALPVIASAWAAAPPSDARLTAPVPQPHQILLPPSLRPPIA
jgi:hypothetical protein